MQPADVGTCAQIRLTSITLPTVATSKMTTMAANESQVGTSDTRSTTVCPVHDQLGADDADDHGWPGGQVDEPGQQTFKAR